VNREAAETEVHEWGEAACTSCGLLFPQRKSYEKQCPVCFKLDKNYDLLWSDKAFLWGQERLIAREKQLFAAQAELSAMKNKVKLLEVAVKTAREQEPEPALLKAGQIPVKDLILLCHPDKHQNSELANEVTKKLLSMRKKT
jgi:hypothetical protein